MIGDGTVNSYISPPPLLDASPFLTLLDASPFLIGDSFLISDSGTLRLDALGKPKRLKKVRRLRIVGFFLEVQMSGGFGLIEDLFDS
jgi:hypothetical protein